MTDCRVFISADSVTVHNLRINDRLVNEAALNGLVAGHYGIPVTLVTGDQATVDQAMEIDYVRTDMAQTAALVPGVVRVGPRTVRVEADPEAVFRLQELLVYRLRYEL